MVFMIFHVFASKNKVFTYEFTVCEITLKKKGSPKTHKNHNTNTLMLKKVKKYNDPVFSPKSTLFFGCTTNCRVYFEIFG